LSSYGDLLSEDPTLYSGTLRSNLDPYDELEDAVLERAMKSCGLSETHEAGGPSNGEVTLHAITLKTEISAGGENLCGSHFAASTPTGADRKYARLMHFSLLVSAQGQKQLIALARGLVRRSKIYILDEAVHPY
jgi:ABC-type multidrug transport system fused ATPase/permease subunit